MQDIDKALESLSKVKGAYKDEIATLKQTMTNEILTKANKAGISVALIATFSNLSSVVVPALPGATKTCETFADCAAFHAKACSRPPLPKTKTLYFIAKSFHTI